MAQQDNISIYILNEKNKLITEDYIEKMFFSYGINYKVKNINIFRKAMVHTSYVHKNEEYWQQHRSKNTNQNLDPISNPNLAIPLQKESFEELEFVGDAVIHNILADYFSNRYQGMGEGFFTKLRTRIENGTTLAHFCRAIGLDQYILISRYIEKNNGRANNDNILEDAFESFIGAIYKDSNTDESNFENCRKFIINLLEKEVDFAELLYNETNFKDMLLQYFHTKKWRDPIYNKLNITGLDHQKVFTVSVTKRVTDRDVGTICGTGTGSSKKRAEQSAAKEALIRFGAYSENKISQNDTDIIEG